MITDKYNDEKAVSLRKKLQAYYDEVKELEYRIFLISKEAQQVGDEYNKYLGLETNNGKKS